MEYISIKEYARRKGCSDTNVRKAILTGKIVEGVTKRNGKPFIIPHIADEEWKTNFRVNRVQNQKLTSGFSGGEQLEPVDEIDDDEAVEEAPAPIVEKARKERAVIPDKLPKPGQKDTRKLMADAQVKERVFKAQLAELTYKEKLGTLVNKKDVYNELFAFAKEVKEDILNIPDRIIDDMWASKTRNEAYLLLVNELTAALERLSGMENLNIAKPDKQI